jgi:hypothetical protein
MERERDEEELDLPEVQAYLVGKTWSRKRIVMTRNRK